MSPILSIENVSKRFGGLQALNDVSFEVGHNSVTALIGPNGSGKSTLLNIISGMLKCDRGRILLNGREIRGASPDRVSRMGISRTFQIVRLFGSLNVLENVMVGAHNLSTAGLVRCTFRFSKASREERAIEDQGMKLLQEVGLEKKASILARNLPHGLQRYLELARALAGKPNLLLLDEPSGGLNPRETKEFVELLNKIRVSGTTILLVEHNMSIVTSLSSHVVVLNYGVKIAEGPPASVVTNGEVIEAYLGKGSAHA